jgi:hypothetical protein
VKIEMKNLKIIILATTIAILAVATVGVVLAHRFASPYYTRQTQYSTPISNEEWWDEMIEHMEERWNQVDQTTDGDWWDEMIEHMEDRWDNVPQQVQDEEWFNDMRAYIQDHVDEVQTQDWFDEMTEFMEENFGNGYRYSYSPRSYGRGCWGW